MTKVIESKVLAAYADGALDPDQAAEVKAALATNPAAREELRWLEESKCLLQSAYGEIAAEPLPEGLRARVMAQPPKALPDAAPPRWRWGFPALAASLLAFLIGLPSGYLLSDLRHAQEMQRFETLRAADQQAMAEALADALEKHLSGHSVDWQVPASGSRGSVTPVRSFRNADGRWCREYRQSIVTEAGQEERQAIACRNENGNWRTRLVATNES